MLQISVMMGLIFPTYGYVIKVGKGVLERFFQNEVSYGSLESCYSISDSKLDSAELVKMVVCLECCIFLLFFLNRYLMICTLRPCLHERKWNHSKTSSNRHCVYTRTVGTVPFGTCYPFSFGSATEVVPFGTVPFGSRVNGQNRLELSQMRTLRKRDYYALV